MRIFTDGSRDLNCQVNRIDEGFAILGHDLTNDIQSADLIYSNNPNQNWDLFISEKEAGKIKGKIIFNVLDIPEWNFPNFDLEDLYEKLVKADKVTSISRFVSNQLVKYYNLPSAIIYNPTQDVTDKYRAAGIRPYPQFRAMMIGRLRDPSKRASLAAAALNLAGFKPEEVAVVGTEPIGWGQFVGQVSVEDLERLHNSVEFVMMTSFGEGLGLPGCEAFLGGAVPVVCHDLTTFPEFYFPALGNYPTVESVAFFLGRGRDYYYAKYQDQMMTCKRRISNNLEKVRVAEKIIEAYASC